MLRRWEFFRKSNYEKLQSILFFVIAVGILLLIRFVPIWGWLAFEKFLVERLQLKQSTINVFKFIIWLVLVIVLLFIFFRHMKKEKMKKMNK